MPEEHLAPAFDQLGEAAQVFDAAVGAAAHEDIVDGFAEQLFPGFESHVLQCLGIAGTIWNALNETEGMTAKQLKKATKLVDKDLFLGLGWLLREDKVSVEEVEGELFIKLI